jgi:SSS family solute:Na+ symporter
MRAVLYSDMMQAIVMITGAIAVTVIGLVKIGGWDGLTETTQPMFLSLWRDTSDPDFPWTGIIFGAPILAVWYWCTDQFIVQRTLSAESIAAARRATIFAALLKQLPMFIFVLPGVIAYALAEKGLLQLTDPDQALPALIGALLPIGIKGLVVAGLLAALMSSLSSVFNSCATLITMDVYKKLAPNQSEARLVLVGQLSTLVMVLFGLAWIPFMDVISSQLYIYTERSVLHLTADCCRVSGRRDLAASKRQGCDRNAFDWFSHWHCSACRRNEPGIVHGRVALFCDHQFPSLRRHLVRCVGRHSRCGESLVSTCG